MLLQRGPPSALFLFLEGEDHIPRSKDTLKARLDTPKPAEVRRLKALLALPAEEAARRLLGTLLVRVIRGRALPVRIVETEAYLGSTDPAAHSYRGRTERTAPLWGAPGTIYVYFVYGMYHCLNFAASAHGIPECVLIRAGEPAEESGLSKDSCRGPGRLCRALGIDARASGSNLFARGSTLYLREGTPPKRFGVSTRVGIRLAAERLLRFYDADSPAVSRMPGVRAANRAES
jgi:DNA-3-methyladenine glycosylase